MSGRLVGMVFDHYPYPGGEKLLAVKLADNAHDNGCHIFPSVATLARQTGQSERTVQYQLKRMMQRGWLMLVRYAGGGRGHAREYRINPEFIAAYDTRILPEQRPAWAFKNPRAESAGENAAPDAGGAIKGADSAPFISAERVQSEALKGAIAIAAKGATAIAPQPSLTLIEQTPLPPTGGHAVEKTQEAELLAELVSLHGRHATSDTTAAARALQAVPDLERHAQAMRLALQAEVQSALWQRDDGRYRHKLSRWIRGWWEAHKAGLQSAQGAPPGGEAQAPDAAAVSRAAIAATMANSVPPPPEILERINALRRPRPAAVQPPEAAHASAVH
jgi:hypothetical protein